MVKVASKEQEAAEHTISARGSYLRAYSYHQWSIAFMEHTDPRRSLTTTVAVEGARWPRLPVKTDGTIPKDQVLAACRSLASVRVTAPVRLGDVVVDDVAGTGCAVVATRDMPTA